MQGNSWAWKKEAMGWRAETLSWINCPLQKGPGFGSMKSQPGWLPIKQKFFGGNWQIQNLHMLYDNWIALWLIVPRKMAINRKLSQGWLRCLKSPIGLQSKNLVVIDKMETLPRRNGLYIYIYKQNINLNLKITVSKWKSWILSSRVEANKNELIDFENEEWNYLLPQKENRKDWKKQNEPWWLLVVNKI